MLFSDVGIYWSGNVKMVKNRALMMPRCACLSHTVSHTVRAVVVLHGSSSCTWCCSGLLSGRCCCRSSALVLRPREVGRAPQTGAWRCNELCCEPEKPCKIMQVITRTGSLCSTIGQLLANYWWRSVIVLCVSFCCPDVLRSHCFASKRLNTGQPSAIHLGTSSTLPRKEAGTSALVLKSHAVHLNNRMWRTTQSYYQ